MVHAKQKRSIFWTMKRSFCIIYFSGNFNFENIRSRSMVIDFVFMAPEWKWIKTKGKRIRINISKKNEIFLRIFRFNSTKWIVFFFSLFILTLNKINKPNNKATVNFIELNRIKYNACDSMGKITPTPTKKWADWVPIQYSRHIHIDKSNIQTLAQQ